jgi:SpoVK/Ycf46/Vps4 family AAA+-type ATPase
VFAKSMVRTHDVRHRDHPDREEGRSSASPGCSSTTRARGVLRRRRHEVLKEWLVKRRRGFTTRARDFGLPVPKGILLIGVPGCGKSLTAKAVGACGRCRCCASTWARSSAGLVGSSEENMRKVIKTAEAIAPAMLWLDELEKGFSGTQSSGRPTAAPRRACSARSSPGCRRRPRSVFVIATANDVSRCCRPSCCARGASTRSSSSTCPPRTSDARSIDIHLRKKARDPGGSTSICWSTRPRDFSGAELEQAVVARAVRRVRHRRTTCPPRGLETDAEATSCRWR